MMDVVVKERALAFCKVMSIDQVLELVHREGDLIEDMLGTQAHPLLAGDRRRVQMVDVSVIFD